MKEFDRNSEQPAARERLALLSRLHMPALAERFIDRDQARDVPGWLDFSYSRDEQGALGVHVALETIRLTKAMFDLDFEPDEHYWTGGDGIWLIRVTHKDLGLVRELEVDTTRPQLITRGALSYVLPSLNYVSDYVHFGEHKDRTVVEVERDGSGRVLAEHLYADGHVKGLMSADRIERSLLSWRGAGDGDSRVRVVDFADKADYRVKLETVYGGGGAEWDRVESTAEALYSDSKYDGTSGVRHDFATGKTERYAVYNFLTGSRAIMRVYYEGEVDFWKIDDLLPKDKESLGMTQMSKFGLEKEKMLYLNIDSDHQISWGMFGVGDKEWEMRGLKPNEVKPLVLSPDKGTPKFDLNEYLVSKREVSEGRHLVLRLGWDLAPKEWNVLPRTSFTKPPTVPTWLSQNRHQLWPEFFAKLSAEERASIRSELSLN